LFDADRANALQGRFGYRYFSAFLLFSHHRYEFDVRPGIGVAEVLRQRRREPVEQLGGKAHYIAQQIIWNLPASNY
jgi:hypothetical protein